MKNWKVVFGRLLPYWATVFTSIWILCFLYVWPFDNAYEIYVNWIVEPVRFQSWRELEMTILVDLLSSILFPVATSSRESQSPGPGQQSCRIPWSNSCLDVSLFPTADRQHVAHLKTVMDEQVVLQVPSPLQKGCRVWPRPCQESVRRWRPRLQFCFHLVDRHSLNHFVLGFHRSKHEASRHGSPSRREE